jgi:hypothetical protein
LVIEKRGGERERGRELGGGGDRARGVTMDKKEREGVQIKKKKALFLVLVVSCVSVSLEQAALMFASLCYSSALEFGGETGSFWMGRVLGAMRVVAGKTRRLDKKLKGLLKRPAQNSF